MKVVAIIQARLGSTRLPGKVVMDLGGKPVLQWVIDAAKAAKRVHEVVVTTPDWEIMEYCKRQGIRSFLGVEEEVLYRFIGASLETRAEKIVRLTADCPFVDPAVIDQCICEIPSMCAVNEWPDGLDVQVFDASWLMLGDREHVVPANNILAQLKCPAGNLRDIRVTLDTPSDLLRLRAIAEHLPKDRPPHWEETLAAYAKLEKIAA